MLLRALCVALVGVSLVACSPKASVKAAKTADAHAPAAKAAPSSAEQNVQDFFPVAKLAATNFLIAHPDATDKQLDDAGMRAARAAGDPSAAITADDIGSDAKAWVAERKSNGFPPLTSAAQLRENDAASDARDKEEAAKDNAEHPGAGLTDDVPDEPSRGAHYFPALGTCFTTQVASVASRLENTPDSGSQVSYTDGHSQVSYETSDDVQEFRVGDPIRLCVTQLPGHCPPTDDRGVTYLAVNGRTGGKFEAASEEHMCGGA